MLYRSYYCNADFFFFFLQFFILINVIVCFLLLVVNSVNAGILYDYINYFKFYLLLW